MNELLDWLVYAYKLVMANFTNIGIVITLFLWARKSTRKMLNVHFDKMTSFSVILIFLACIRFCLLDLSGNGDSLRIVNQIPFSRLLLVGMEDVFFAIIPMYLTKLCKSKHLKLAVWLVFSIAFGLGHVYQGWFVASILALYPYYISRKYIEKTSLGTVMAGHLMYDVTSIITVKLFYILRMF